jgi:hypothetical protein
MGSTLGGFLIGFGLCLLIFSGAGIYGSYTSYYRILEWVDEISLIYNITHSDLYVRSLNTMSNITSILGSIRDLLKQIPAIRGIEPQISSQVSDISQAVAVMKEIQAASERAMEGISLVNILPWIFVAMTIIASIMIMVGVNILKRGSIH